MSKRIVVCLTFLTFSLSAASARASEESSREHHRFGAYFGLIDPLPSLYAINLGINVTSFFRAIVGYGGLSGSVGTSTFSFTTLSVGGRFFVPNWSLSPTVGLAYGHVNGSASDGTSHQGFEGSGDHVYASIGIDWQMHCGFNLGGGWNQSLKSGVGGLPYLDIGWYF